MEPQKVYLKCTLSGQGVVQCGVVRLPCIFEVPGVRPLAMWQDRRVASLPRFRLERHTFANPQVKAAYSVNVVSIHPTLASGAAEGHVVDAAELLLLECTVVSTRALLCVDCVAVL